MNNNFIAIEWVFFSDCVRLRFCFFVFLAFFMFLLKYIVLKHSFRHATLQKENRILLVVCFIRGQVLTNCYD